MIFLSLYNPTDETVLVFNVDAHGTAHGDAVEIGPDQVAEVTCADGHHLEVRELPIPASSEPPAEDEVYDLPPPKPDLPLADEEWRQWAKPFAVYDDSGVQVSTGFLSQVAAVLAFATGTRPGWTVRDAAGVVVHSW
jgi:hypothetical protein